MAENLVIKIELAEIGSKQVDDASEILSPFALLGSSQARTGPDRAYGQSHFFAKKDQAPGILGVCYLGDLAVTAMSGLEYYMTPNEYDGPEEKDYYFEPYFGIFTIATDPTFRGQGVASKLLDVTLDLAHDTGLERVQAIWVAHEKVEKFWAKNGFRDVPFPTFGDMELKTQKRRTDQDKRGVEVNIDPKVTARLEQVVVDASIAKQAVSSS